MAAALAIAWASGMSGSCSTGAAPGAPGGSANRGGRLRRFEDHREIAAVGPGAFDVIRRPVGDFHHDARDERLAAVHARRGHASRATRRRPFARRAFDATFGKSSTSRRGWSWLSLTSAGISRPLPPSVTVVAPAAWLGQDAIEHGRVRRSARGTCGVGAGDRGALPGRSRAAPGPPAGAAAVSSRRIRLRVLRTAYSEGRASDDADARQRLAVGRAGLLERDRRRSDRGARRGSRRWRPRRCAARRAASADRAASRRRRPARSIQSGRVALPRTRRAAGSGRSPPPGDIPPASATAVTSTAARTAAPVSCAASAASSATPSVDLRVFRISSASRARADR